jgi:hypothetical protein
MTLSVKLILATLCLLIAFAGGYSVRATKAEAEIATLVAKHEKATKERAERFARDLTRAVAEERAVQRQLQEAQDAETRRREAADAARHRANAAVVGLRDELADLRAELDAIKGNPAASPGCKAAAEAGAMCAHLLGRCSERRRELAEFAESSAGAGQLCVSAYEALTPPGPPGP